MINRCIFFLIVSSLLSCVLGDSILYTSVRDAPSLCDDFFDNLTNPHYKGPNMSVEIGNMYLYSGHSLVDLGWYDLCRQQPTQRYSLLSIEGIGIGFCGPSFCNIAQLQGYSDKILQMISNITQKDLSPSTVSFIDPDETGITKGFWFYFTLLLFTTLFGFVIAGTVMAWQKKRKARLQYTFVSSDSIVKDAVNSNSSVFVNSGIFKSHIEPRPIETPSPNSPTSPASTPPLHIKIIQCFDIVENFEALFKDEKIPGHDQNLNVIAGIRTLAFCWVVYGHTMAQGIIAKNFTFIASYWQSPWLLIELAAYFAVDTFFYLSGFFTGFLMAKKLKNMPMSLQSFGLVVFHRWIRLWPSYFVMILFYWKISVYFGSGPLWPNYVTAANLCDHAWQNLLFLDNVLIGSFEEYCVGWGWYISCDFQMFLLAPFICWIYIKDRKRSQTILTTLMVVSLCASYAYLSDAGFSYTLSNDNNAKGDFSGDYYINPIVRMSPYIIGIWLGFMFKEYKDGETNFFTTLKKSYKKSIISSLSGIVILLILTFVPRMLQTGSVWSDGFARTWSTFSRPLWVIGIFFITAPCLVGNLKTLSEFLGNFYFILISRLSYTAYLIHYVFLLMIYDGMTQYYGASVLYQSCLALAICFTACFGATIIHLFVEKPITNIETNILSRKKGARTVLGERNVKTTEFK